MPEISKSYEPRDVEEKWYAAWQAAGAFAGRTDDGREPYCIVIPPPNVTGVLTMGHVLNNTIQDILARRARLEGKSVLWLPGTDHAGIATQTVVERTLKKSGEIKHRDDLGREKFLTKVWEWKEKHGGIIIQQLKKLGCSCDWDRERFTMDADYSRCVQKVFVELYKKGLIYRGKRMVNWCPASLTALSDEEVVMKEQRGTLCYFKVEVAESPGTFLTIATTRPETIPGDTAVAVNPKDPRYAHLIGQHIVRPLPAELPREQKLIPIVGDEHVDFEFGTGVLKVTPAHDKADFDIGQRHKLAQIEVIAADGKMNDAAGADLRGLDRFKARKVAVEKLTELGALVKEEPYTNNVGYSERADVPIEPRLSEQWFLKYPSVEKSRAVVASGEMKFHPERWAKVYDHWMGNIQDWCVSRQLWWGHRVPVWQGMNAQLNLPAPKLRQLMSRAIDNGPPVTFSLSDQPGHETVFFTDTLQTSVDRWIQAATISPIEAKILEQAGFTQDPDVLDTWFSSWLWPFATMGWPEQTATLKKFYPTTTLVTGPDIIFFWVARMIMAGYEFMGQLPFKHVYFTGIIRDQQGRKMSKSLGNSPDPLDLIAKYGADGLRFGIISIAPQGQDIRFQEDRIEGGKNFCNKLWNACRFRQMSGPMADNSTPAAILARLEPAKFDADDHAILDRLLSVTREVDRCFAEFEFSAAVQALYGFFWNDFCDWYVEVSKAKLQSPDLKANCLAIQDLVLRKTLRLLHPFIPFITEELWAQLGYGRPGRFMEDGADPIENASQLASHYPPIDANAAAEVERIKQTVSALRALKADHGEAARKDSTLTVEAEDRQWAAVSANLAKLQRMLGAASITRAPAAPGAPACVTAHGTWNLVRNLSAADTAAEKARLAKELETLTKHIAATEARLGNEAFVSKAPPAVLAGAKKQLADQQAKHAELARLLAALK
jgi:valyl-tRNA synthetase